MSSLAQLCDDLYATLDDVLVCGVIDRAQSRVVAARAQGGLDPELERVLLDATLELLGRPPSPDSQNDGRQYSEVQVADASTRYYAKACAGGHCAVLLVTRKTTSTGLAWAQLKSTVAAVECAQLVG